MSEEQTPQEPISETGQTGQTEQEEQLDVGPAKTQPFWELAQDPETELWHFMLWSINNRAMVISGRGYKRRNDATDAIDLIEEMLAEKPRRLINAD